MITIQMLKTKKDGRLTIWNKGDVYNVEDTDNSFYTIKELNGELYGIDKKETKEFIVIEKESE